MTQELQPLLDRIRQEGVDKAQEEARTIIADARRQAAEIVAQAKSDAARRREEAERDAAAFDRRAAESIRQAGRDVRIQVEQDLIQTLERLLRREVDGVVSDGQTLAGWISDAVAAYLKGGEKEIEVVCGGSAAAHAAGLVERLRSEVGGTAGVAVTPDPAFPNGCTLRLDGGRIEHGFTTEAITGALARLLRPQLVELLKATEG